MNTSTSQFEIPPKSMEGAFPHFTVSVLPYDPDNYDAAFLWRGNNVRSAKNCLAIPSGLLDHGEYCEGAIFRELKEELDLDLADTEMDTLKFYSIYHNMPGDGFHWVIGVWLLPVVGLRDRICNREPDKHDCVATIPLKLIRLLAQRDMQPGTTPLFAGNLAPQLIKLIDHLI